MILAESTATLWLLCAIMSLETSYFLQSNRFDNWETSSHLLNTFFSKSVLQKYCHMSTRFRHRNSVVQVKWFYLQWRWVVLLIKSSSYSQFKSLLFTRSNKGGDFMLPGFLEIQRFQKRKSLWSVCCTFVYLGGLTAILVFMRVSFLCPFCLIQSFVC